MNIEKITIHNIASLEHAEIDFTASPLADDVRFLICGPTGSGKSTILDAICLALYNNTPRLAAAKNETFLDSSDDFKVSRDDGRVAIDDPRMLMRKGTAECYVKLQFTDKDDRRLVAEWSCSKARQKVDGKVQDVKWVLLNEQGVVLTQKKTETAAEIRDSIGLTFEQFCRTTMLAQGDFTRFLKADDSEKSEILERLTGTEIHSYVSVQIHKKMKDKEKVLERKEAALGGIILMEDEQRTGHMERIEELQKLIAAVKKEEAAVAALIDNLKRREEISHRMSIYAADQESCRREHEELCSGNIFVSEYISKISAEISTLESALAAMEPDVEMYRNVSVIEEKLRQVSQARGAVAACDLRRAQLNTEYAALKKSLDEAMKKYEEAKAKADADEHDLAQAKTLLEQMQLHKLLEEKKALETSKATIDDALRMLEQSGEAANRLAEAENALTGCKAELKAENENLEVLVTSLDDAGLRFERQKLVYEAKETACKDILKEYRVRLSEGDLCPLCGQNILHLTTDEEFESVLKPEKELLDAIGAEKEGLRTEVSRARASVESHKKLMNDAQANLEKAQKKCDETADALRSHVLYEDRTDLKKALEQKQSDAIASISDAEVKVAKAMERQNEVDRLQKVRDDSAKAAQNADSAKMEAQRKIDASLAEQKSNDERQNEHKESATRLLAEVSLLINIESWLEKWESDASGFMNHLKTAASKWENTGKELVNKRQVLERAQVLFGDVSQIRSDIVALHQEWVIPSGLAPSRIEDLLNRWTDLKAKVLSNHRMSVEAQKEQSKLMSDYPEGELRTRLQLEQAQSELREKMSSYNEENGAKHEQIANDDEQRRRMGRACDERDKAKEEYQAWYRLHELFGSADGKKMRNIAQSYVLKHLLSGANVYLQQLSDKYELTGQSGSLTILLKDIESGGVLRPTSTLSGGESFLISLALALGLSSLSNKTQAMDILFIDEGFGTLDRASLELVMNTLERLHQMGGRKVGIISHVESMSESITTQIQVNRVNGTLSRLDIVSIV